MSQQPHIIDIRGLVEGDAPALARVAHEVAAPCEEWGAFQILGHGLDTRRLSAFDAAVRAFFDLPDAAKQGVRRTRDNAWGYYDEELTKNRPDWKEIFDYGPDRVADAVTHSDGFNQWPEGEPALRADLLEHYDAFERVARALLRALCVSLGVHPDALDFAFEEHTSYMRLNRYAPCADPAPPDAPLFPERGRLGVHHHTDAGVLTVLYQDGVPGLQVMRDDTFVLVEPVPGALTVNLGDMLQVWSNDRYRSPLHRVLASGEMRHSAPFFLNPSYTTECRPLDALVGPGEPARYRPISWAEFRGQRSAGDYADYGAEVQIADFRI